MRRGQVLATETPVALMANYQKNSLEDVFLHLCRASEDSVPEDDVCTTSNRNLNSREDELTPLLAKNEPKKKMSTSARRSRLPNWCCCQLPRAKNIRALMIKNTLRLTYVRQKVSCVVYGAVERRQPKWQPVTR